MFKEWLCLEREHLLFDCKGVSDDCCRFVIPLRDIQKKHRSTHFTAPVKCVQGHLCASLDASVHVQLWISSRKRVAWEKWTALWTLPWVLFKVLCLSAVAGYYHLWPLTCSHLYPSMIQLRLRGKQKNKYGKQKNLDVIMSTRYKKRRLYPKILIEKGCKKRVILISRGQSKRS